MGSVFPSGSGRSHSGSSPSRGSWFTIQRPTWTGGLRDEVREEVAETGGDVHDSGTDRLEHLGGGRGSEGHEKDEERDATPGEDLLDHPGLPPLWPRRASGAGIPGQTLTHGIR